MPPAKKKFPSTSTIKSNASTVLSYWTQRISGFVLGLAILIGFLLKFGKNEATKFKVDYSQTAGKVVLLTGGDSEIGYETGLTLLSKEAKLILTCQDLSVCNKAKSKMKKIHPKAWINVEQLDLGSISSIREFTELAFTKYATDGIDILINNAEINPVSLSQHRRSEREFSTREIDPLSDDPKDNDIYGEQNSNSGSCKEPQLEALIKTNHLGPFLLTSSLFPLLNEHGRIVNHSGFMHYFADLNYLQYQLNEDFQPSYALSKSQQEQKKKEKEALSTSDPAEQSGLPAPKDNSALLYANTQLSLLQWTYKLNKLLKQNNPKKIQAVAVNSGSYFFHFFDSKLLNGIFNTFFALDAKLASLSLVYAAVDPKIEASVRNYISPRFFFFGRPAVKSTNSVAWDRKLQDQLWQLSEKITETSFKLD